MDDEARAELIERLKAEAAAWEAARPDMHPSHQGDRLRYLLHCEGLEPVGLYGQQLR